MYELDKLEVDLVLGSKVGWRYKTTPEAGKITQLLCDSAVFDFSDYAGKMDLVFVDGSHASAYVRSDTENAFRLIHPVTGVIVWHDYGNEFPDVKTHLNNLANDRQDLDLFTFEVLC